MLADSRSALIAVSARDFERAVTFYKDVLGLPMTFRVENRWAEFKAPGLTVGVAPADDLSVVGGGTTAIVFEVLRIERFVEALRSRGVSFQGPVAETFHGKVASFTDSEGNPLTLHESVPAYAGPEAASSARASKASPGGRKPAPSRAPARRAGSPAKPASAKGKAASKPKKKAVAKGKGAPKSKPKGRGPASRRGKPGKR